ncbi:MAG: cytochrome c oxidase accessory protein CcoG [Pontibacterium sp.]
MSQIPVKNITPPPSKTNSQHEKTESFDLYAKREHIYVKYYRGFLKNLRTGSSVIMLLMFFGFSWLQWDGKQAVLFDLPNRQFHVFGTTFWPQDFMLLSALLIILAFVLFFVTAFAGRLWCGYACPQFVWTWFFIWAERIAEGDRNARMKLAKEPMSANKFIRRTIKHSLWVIIAIASSIAFVGYFTPIRELTPNVLTLNLGPWEAWWVGFIAVATYGNAGWLREQVCIYMCPYARFQSVMFDQDTLIISYDAARGETRGKRKKGTDYKAQGLGDCIDCHACVHVCPVGIDIRDGLQYECVACGACVDACDDMMDRVGYERGLVRYTTEHQLEGKKTHIFRPKLIAYFVLLVGLCAAFTYALINRVPIEVDVLRDRGKLYTQASNGHIENVYTLKIANKENSAHRFKITVKGSEGFRLLGTSEVTIEGGKLVTVPLRLQLDPKYINQPNYDVTFNVQALDDPQINSEVVNRFISPVSR